jgi:hypothetical protein
MREIRPNSLLAQRRIELLLKQMEKDGLTLAEATRAIAVVAANYRTRFYSDINARLTDSP